MMIFLRRRRPLLLGGIALFLLVCAYMRLDVKLSSYRAFKPEKPADLDFTSTSPDILLVSAFFPLAKSKHSISEYEYWISRFLTPIDTPMYFFTSPEMEPMVRRLRGGLPITINTKYSTPFDVPPLKGLEVEYARMHLKDREREIHSPELYAAWNVKAHLLAEGVANARADGKVYDYAFWDDAGSFRGNHVYTKWPNGHRVAEVFQVGSELSGTEKEDLIFYAISSAPRPSLGGWVESDGPLDTMSQDFSQGSRILPLIRIQLKFFTGSFFGGSPSAISWWNQTFYAYHDYWLFQMDYFVGKDQTVFNSLFLLFPERFITMWLHDPQAPNYVGLPGWPLGPCGPTWFYFQFYLASEEDVAGMRQLWKSSVTGLWTLFTDGYCRMARTLSMEGLLKRQFGPRWVAPERTVDTSVSQRP